MNFWEALDELDEIYLSDFNNEKQANKRYYHFFTDFEDLLNCLVQHRIYSNKNLRKTQFDRYAKDTDAYICMTQTLSGKNNMVDQYDRPYGITFKTSTFKKICADNGYTFDLSQPFSQFGEKSLYKHNVDSSDARVGEFTFANKDLSDFEIFAIGELSDGEYFISGGQGASMKNLWSAKIFSDQNLYNTLKKWFVANMESPENSYKYYYLKDHAANVPFKDPVFGKDSAGTIHVINTSDNLNKNYKPRQNLDKNKGKLDIYDSSIDFASFTGLAFKELIGLGPAWFTNAENSNMNIRFAKPNSSRGYVGLKFFGKDADNAPFPSEPQYVFGKSRAWKSLDTKTKPIHLVADEQTYKALCSVYNENEYRVYIPNKKDFLFQPTQIDSIILPQYFQAATVDLIDIKALIGSIDQYANLPDKELIKALCTNGIIQPNNLRPKKYIKSGDVQLRSQTLLYIKVLINLCLTKYRNVGIEIIPDKVNKASNPSYNFNKDNSEDTFSSETLRKNNHRRYLLTQHPDMSRAVERAGYAGATEETTHKSVFAPVALPDGTEITARIGSEVVIIGRDSHNNRYVLFINNAHKSENFLELPGGGFYSKSDTALNIAKQRLQFKAGLDINRVSKLSDTGYGLLLFEDGVAQNKEVTWEASYYYLFTANYTDYLTREDLEFSHNNGEYTAMCRWIPVKQINLNRSIVTRYSNLLNKFI